MSTNTQKGAAKPTSRKFAKSVIEIWLWGGPSQLETFDPKPDAPHDYNNGLKSIKSSCGYELHEWLPEPSSWREAKATDRIQGGGGRIRSAERRDREREGNEKRENGG